VSRGAQIFLAAIAIATVCALVVIQRAKDAPALVRHVHVTPVFTPNGDGYRDATKIRFKLGRGDDLTVSILDGRGQAVRRLAVRRRTRADREVRLDWDGRTDRGAPAPPAVYRVEVRLDRRDRSIELRTSTRLSARRPHARGG
jgi:FlgD Ig-like domain